MVFCTTEMPSATLEPPRRQGRQGRQGQHWNRQGAKNAKGNICEPQKDSPINNLGVLGALAVQVAFSWRSWRLGGSKRFFLSP
jgi:hypothetical protein